MRGLFVPTGSQIQLSNLEIRVREDGEVDLPPPAVKVRTMVWPTWIEEAIDGACAAIRTRPEIAAAVNDTQLGPVVRREWRASMRTVAACAFAIDAFYGVVKELGGPHPDQVVWAKNGTARRKQVVETLRYSLKLDNNATAATRERVNNIFTLRDLAVHPGHGFMQPLYRPDIDCAVDHNVANFTSKNAEMAVWVTVDLFKALVPRMGARSIPELVKAKPLAEEALAALVVEYEATELFPLDQFPGEPDTSAVVDP